MKELEEEDAQNIGSRRRGNWGRRSWEEMGVGLREKGVGTVKREGGDWEKRRWN